MNTTTHIMKRFALLILAICFALVSQAQQNTLNIVPNSFRVSNLSTGLFSSDTLFTSYGDSIEYEALVIYNGVGFITDLIGFGLSKDSLMGSTSDSVFRVGASPDTIFNGDTLLIKVVDRLDSTMARYSGGTGGGAIVVVVWPVLRAAPSLTESSMDIILNFAERTAAEDLFLSGRTRITCFPNPAQSRLFFKSTQNLSKFEYVRIHDLNGRLLLLQQDLPLSLDISLWSQGFYILEVGYKDGFREVIKIIKR